MEIRTTAEITAQTMTANYKEWANVKWIRIDDIKKVLCQDCYVEILCKK